MSQSRQIPVKVWTRPCKVPPRVYGHADVRLEGERVDGARVYGLDGCELLLVLIHEIREAVDEYPAVAGVHAAPLALLKGAFGGVDCAVDVLQ